MLWGIIPLCTVIIAFVLNVQSIWIRALKTKIKRTADFLSYTNNYSQFSKGLLQVTHAWTFVLSIILLFGLYQFYIKNDRHRSPENAILAYYDALDFKEFENAYGMIDPKSNISIDQYMLEVSVTDGLLSSYAKLNTLKTQVTTSNDSLATVKVITDWITPLEKINKVTFKTLTKRNSKWYIQPEPLQTDLPPDQLYSGNTTNYYNQGDYW